MKKVIILHGTNSNSKANWFPWLKHELEEPGASVWVPDLPHPEKPNIQRYSKYILENAPWEFDRQTVIIGHSSGAVAILGPLHHLPRDIKVSTCILVGSFKNDLGWKALNELFLENLQFESIRQKADKFIFIHSNNDPYCPLEYAQYLADQLHGELIIKEGQGHFSTEGNPKYRQFPFLLELLQNWFFAE